MFKRLLAMSFVCIALCGYMYSIHAVRAAQTEKNIASSLHHSVELVLKQQDVSLDYHYEMPDGTFLLTGGTAASADGKKVIRMPLEVLIDSDGNLLSGRIFSKVTDLKFNDKQTVRPLLGFSGSFLPLGRGFVVPVYLDKVDENTKHTGESIGLLARLDEHFKFKNVYSFLNHTGNAHVSFSSGVNMGNGEVAYIGAEDGLIEEKKARFISIFNSNLDNTRNIPLPPACMGGLFYNQASEKFITFPRYIMQEKRVCLIPKDGGKIETSSLPKGFEINDMLSTEDGGFIVVGKQQLEPKEIGEFRNVPTRLLRFDYNLKFVSGIEFTDVLDDHDNKLFRAPDGGYLLSLVLREGPVMMQTKTAFVRVDRHLSFMWARLLEGTGPENVHSAFFRNDGSLSVLAKLEMFETPKFTNMMGQAGVVYDMTSHLDSFEIVEISKDGEESGEATEAYKPKLDVVSSTEGALFGPLKVVNNFSLSSALFDRGEVNLIAQNFKLERKTLGRPWDDMQFSP